MEEPMEKPSPVPFATALRLWPMLTFLGGTVLPVH